LITLSHLQAKRGALFETAFANALAASGFDVFKIGKIVNESGHIREIDASVRLGSEHLVLFECRSMERPLDFEVGRPRTFAERQRQLTAKVAQVLSLRDFVRENPKGRNYDFSWAKTITPFVVSPFVEWIWERTELLWHDSNTPRILQADEAIRFLEAHRRN
jgi:hypothetical protein